MWLRFGQPIEDVLEVLRNRRTSARILLVLLLVIDATALGGVLYAASRGVIVMPLLGIIALAMWTWRCLRMLTITRESIAQLEAKSSPLPRATLVRS